MQSPTSGVAATKATLAQIMTLVNANAQVAESQVTGLGADLAAIDAALLLLAPIATPAFTGQVTITAATTDLFLMSGTMGLQEYATNNCWLSDNLYFDGTDFRYKADGYAAMIYFLAGGWRIQVAPLNSSGPGALVGSPPISIGADNAGNVTCGGPLTAASFTAMGASSGYVLDRRDTNAACFQIYSGGGIFQVYGYALGGDVLEISGTGALSLAGPIGVNGASPPAKASTPTTLAEVITILQNIGFSN